VPGTGSPTPDTGFWVRLTAAAVAALLVGGYLVARQLGDDEVRTGAGGRSPTTAASLDAAGSSPSATAASPSASATPTPSPTDTERPPTLAFVVLRKAYITVRVPGGRTLVSRAFPKGARRTFDQKALQVVNGRPSAVRFTVNGKPRKQGDPTEPETFTVRRR
jgi:hypothetical protein